ncbi:MAG: hypothetical protein AAGD38_20600 [Acidobacteriota bacterium]
MANGHDQLFKTLLTSYPADFLSLVHPDLLTRVDPKRIRFESIELYLDTVPGAGRPRRPDLVAELYTRDNTQRPVGCLHVEIENRFRQRTRSRLAAYNQLISLRYGVPVATVGLFLRGGPAGIEIAMHQEQLFGEILARIVYRTLGLSAAEAVNYLDRSEPLAWALAALMRPPPGMNRLEHRIACLARVANNPDHDPRKAHLIDCVDAYLPVAVDERDAYEKLLQDIEEVRELTLTWSESFREEGRIAGKRETLLHQVERRLGDVTTHTKRRVESIEDSSELDRMLDAFLDGASLDELGLI